MEKRFSTNEELQFLISQLELEEVVKKEKKEDFSFSFIQDKSRQMQLSFLQ